MTEYLAPTGRAAMRALFRCNKAVARTSAHALADAHEIATAYQELTTTGRQLKVAMPVMTAFEPDIRRFEARRGQASPTG